jgi:[FeFe] hydrogenase H-cluster maturation GTPase HydF
MTQTAPASLRLHLGLYGRRNAGKSSLVNALTGQQVAIVSPVAGTTTDPVEKAMELLPLGPVLFMDTAGIDDDQGDLGAMRIAATRRTLDRCELALIVAGPAGWGAPERSLAEECRRRAIPAIAVFNHADVAAPDPALLTELRAAGLPAVACSALTGAGIADLRAALIAQAPESALAPPVLLGDLVPPGGLAVLVVPIDTEAPKGRLIMPQVQAIRDLLDHDSLALVVKERELRSALERLNRPPDLVVTDSQAFLKVAGDVPDAVPMTSFSILFARLKGDLATLARGAAAIERLKTGDRVLMAESCTHHPIGEDIGRVKIPRWLTQYVGGQLDFRTTAGKDFPADLADHRLVVHCGSCTTNRRLMLTRMEACRAAGVPITNYGLAIAWSLGIFPRALRPFPGVYEEVCRG